MESNTPPKQPQLNQDLSQQMEGHIADSPSLKVLNAVWNQDNEGQICVMPFRLPKKETKSSSGNKS
jgi:hypothetical protein